MIHFSQEDGELSLPAHAHPPFAVGTKRMMTDARLRPLLLNGRKINSNFNSHPPGGRPDGLAGLHFLESE